MPPHRTYETEAGEGIPFWVEPGSPPLEGAFPVYFDGRDETGNFLEGIHAFCFQAPSDLRENFVIVEGNNPGVRGPHDLAPTDVAPAIAVRASLMEFSYDQATSFEYCVDRPSLVTTRVYEPGCGPDEAGCTVVATLETAEPRDAGGCVKLDAGTPQCGDGIDNDFDGQIDTADPDCGNDPAMAREGIAPHRLTWRAEATGDSNRLIGEDPDPAGNDYLPDSYRGSYTLSIEATAQADPGRQTRFLGVIEVYQ
jgi:hypothetical protein